MKDFSRPQLIATAITIPVTLLVCWLVYRKTKAKPHTKAPTVLSEKQDETVQISYSKNYADADPDKNILSESLTDSIDPEQDDVSCSVSHESIITDFSNLNQEACISNDSKNFQTAKFDFASGESHNGSEKIIKTDVAEDIPDKFSHSDAFNMSKENDVISHKTSLNEIDKSKETINVDFVENKSSCLEINYSEDTLATHPVISLDSLSTSSEYDHKGTIDADSKLSDCSVSEQNDNSNKQLIDSPFTSAVPMSTDSNDESDFVSSNVSSDNKNSLNDHSDEDESGFDNDVNVNNNNNLFEQKIELVNGLSQVKDASQTFVLNKKYCTSCDDSNKSSTFSENGVQHNGWSSDCSPHADDEEVDKGFCKKKQLDNFIEGNIQNKSDTSILEVYVEFPSDKVGLLIGKQGRNIKQLKQDSGADVFVHTAKDRDDIQALQIRGTQSEVESCVSRIKRRFNDITLSPFDPVNISTPYTAVSPSSSNSSIGYPMPSISQIRLPEGVGVDVLVSAIAAVDCLFLQHYTHPSFQCLAALERAMAVCYAEPSTPCLPKPMKAGLICAAPQQGMWYRAQVVQSFNETDEILIKFMDYGGYATVSDESVKQIRADFVTLPFQAVECYLDNIIPPEDSRFCKETVTNVAEMLKDGRYQARVTGYTSDGNPKIHLHKWHDNKMFFVNREIATKGFAVWNDPPSPQ